MKTFKSILKGVVVLILVLMEDTLRDGKLVKGRDGSPKVLILVLMEDTLREV